MYDIVLAIHNIMRWVVLVIGFLAVLRAFIGWFGKHAWIPADPKIGSYFAIALDIQLLLGLLLYFVLSPITRTALQDFGAAMSVADIRFFAIEHSLVMVLAVVFAHLGSVFSKRAEKAPDKHRIAAIWRTLALLAILFAIPWARPLFPGF